MKKHVALLLLLFLVLSLLPGSGTGLISPAEAATPTQPTNLVATAESGNQIQLHWQASANAVKYSIIRRTATTGNTVIADNILATNNPTFRDAGFDMGGGAGLLPNTRYFYRVRAYNAAGDFSDYSNEAFADTFATGTFNLSATATGHNSIQLTWQRGWYGFQEAGFVIERCTNSNFTSPQTIAVSAGSTSYPDLNLSPNVTYYYRMRAYDSLNNYSAYSTVAQARTGTQWGTFNLSASAAGHNSIQLTWQRGWYGFQEAGFVIERSTTSNFTSPQTIAVSAGSTSYHDSPLSPNVTYYYRMRAYDSLNNYSAYSNIAQARTGTGQWESFNLRASASGHNSVHLTWTGWGYSHSGAYFEIERRTAGTTYRRVSTVSAHSQWHDPWRDPWHDPWRDPWHDYGYSYNYTDSNLATNTTYYYRIRAYDNFGGYHGYSNEVIVTTGTGTVGAFSLTATATGLNDINLSWSRGTWHHESGFYIERRTASTAFTRIDSVSSGTTSYTDRNLSPNTRYTYRIRAHDATGTIGYSNEASATTTTGVTPAAPSSLQASVVSTDRVALSWTDNSNNEDGFKIERRREGGSYVEVDTVGRNVTNYTDTGLAANTTYSYRVRAYNDAGNSSYTSAVTVTTEGIPAAPTRLSASVVGQDRILLSWRDQAVNASGFKIERRTAGRDYVQIDMTGGTSYTDTNVLPDTTYTYRVRAYNPFGDSPYSATATVRTPGEPVPVRQDVSLSLGSEVYYVDNQPRRMDVAPLVQDGRTLIPVRHVATAMGARVAWDDVEQKVTITVPAENRTVELWVGRNTARVNGVSRQIDRDNASVVPVILDGRTMLPLRFVGESLGYTVDYNERTGEITLK